MNTAVIILTPFKGQMGTATTVTDNSSHPHGQELFFIEKLPQI
jgi:hypothetical protein